MLVLPGAEQARYRWGARPRQPLRRALAPRAGDQSRPAAGDRRERRPGRRHRRVRQLRPATSRARSRRSCAARRAVGAAPERPRLAADGRPPPVHLRRACAPIRGCASPPHSAAGAEHRPPRTTSAAASARRAVTAARGDLRGGRASPRRSRGWSAGPPLLVAGAATPGPRWPPPGCWTGRRSPIPEPPRTRCAARRWSTSGAEVVVTDGNRRRAIAGDERAPTSYRRPSPLGEPHDRAARRSLRRPRHPEPGHLRRCGLDHREPLRGRTAALRGRRRVRQTPSTASSAPPGCCAGRRPRPGSR